MQFLNIQKMKKIYLTLALLTSVTYIWAQLASDALRYSSFQYGGTARSMGVGNAMSVLGGDFGTISINPAGLATYRSSDFTLSMGFMNVNTNAKLNTNFAFDAPLNKVTFNNVGLVLASQPYASSNSKWRTGNFAIGINRLGDFNRTTYYNGVSAGSIVTVFKNQIAIGQWDELGNALAYDALAIYDTTVAGKKTYYSDFDGKENQNLTRYQTIKTIGGVNELAISYAGNFDEKLMIGATIGVPFIKYNYQNGYSERDNDGLVPVFNKLDYNNQYKADGTGINLKIGAIYRPIQAIRLGFAVHTPTSYNLGEIQTADFIYNYTEKGITKNEEVNSKEYEVKYTVNTPLKTMASVGVLVGKYGFISADAEFLNYASARIRFETPDSIGQTRIAELKQIEANVNEGIKTSYKSVVNLRIGAEAVLDIFRLRAGVNILGSAFQNDTKPRMVYSVGAGIRGSNMYFDIAYRYEQQTYSYQPYNTPNPLRQPNIAVNAKSNNVVATLGFRF
jgi:hypothetical protein